MTALDDKAVEKAAAILLGRVNAPEQEVYRAARAAITAYLDEVARTAPSAAQEAEDEQRREIERDVKAKLRVAFRNALDGLPEIAPREIASILSAVHMRDEFWNEGRRLQREHGLDAVAPRVEQECGTGAWSFMRAGVLSALFPAPKQDEPDHAYWKDDWEWTAPWGDRYLLAEDIRLDEPVRIGTLFNGPDKWVARVPITWDEDGCPDETEVQWFDTEDSARSALKRPAPPAPPEEE